VSAGSIAVTLGGILSLGMAAFHVQFPRLFGWGEDFPNLTPLNARVLCTVHVALLLLFVLFGVVSLTCAAELGDAVGAAGVLTLGYSGFWWWRMLWQLTCFRAPPDGRPRRLAVLHYGLTAAFALLAVAYLVPVAARLIAPPP
jgi:hypothetical protein